MLLFFAEKHMFLWSEMQNYSFCSKIVTVFSKIVIVKKQIVLRANFFSRVSPLPWIRASGFISVNFGNVLRSMVIIHCLPSETNLRI